MDGGEDALPDPVTVRVALGQELIGALGGYGLGVGAVPLHQQVGRAPDVDLFGHGYGVRS